jgi:type II secretory pathway component GspD/PulD (secretin)
MNKHFFMLLLLGSLIISQKSFSQMEAKEPSELDSINQTLHFGSVIMDEKGYRLVAVNEQATEVFENISEATGKTFSFIGFKDTTVTATMRTYMAENLIDEAAWHSGAVAMRMQDHYYIYGPSYEEELLHEYRPLSMEYTDLIDEAEQMDLAVSLQGYDNHNTILMRGTVAEIRKAIQTLRQLDNLPNQVGIELLIVDYNHGNNFNWSFDISSGEMARFGEVDYSTNSGSVGFSYDFIENLKPSFKVNLQALVENNYATVVTNPHLLASNGQESSLSIEETRYFVLQRASVNGLTTDLENVDAGINLTIKPIIMGEDRVFLDLSGEVSSFVLDERASSEDHFISTISSEIENRKIILKNGETLILGGLIQSVEDHVDGGFPILKDIPILGYLFKREVKIKQYVETVIYITPHVGDVSSRYVEDEIESYDKVYERMIKQGRKSRKKLIRKIR